MTDAELSNKLFGTPRFRHYEHDCNWIVFRNNVRVVDCPPNYLRHFHGTTLSQCQYLLKDGFAVGLYHAGSQSSPCGIWGCSQRGDCYDRAHLRRGWSFDNEGQIMGGWDCPVVFCWFVREHDLYNHKRLRNGTVVRVLKEPPRQVCTFTAKYTEIHIHMPIYARFKQLPSHWADLQQGRSVVCRACIEHPEDLYCAGEGSHPMTCARVVSTVSAQSQGWLCANSTHQYRCPECDRLHSQCLPCTGQ
jgi:hypothetical protein